MIASSHMMCAARRGPDPDEEWRWGCADGCDGSNPARNVYVRLSRIGNQRSKESRRSAD